MAILLTSGDAAKAIKLLANESIGNTPVGTQFAEVHRVSKILQIGGGLGDGLEAVTGSAAPLRNLRLRWSGIACCCLSRSGVVLLGKSGQRQQHEAQQQEQKTRTGHGHKKTAGRQQGMTPLLTARRGQT